MKKKIKTTLVTLSFLILGCNPTANFENKSLLGSETIDTDMTPATLSLNAPANINSSNVSAYSLSGSCSEEGRDVNIVIGALTFTSSCSTLTWSLTENLSGASEGSLNITVDHSDASGNPAIQETATINKDTMNPTVTLMASGDISSLNQSSYSVSGSCSENTRDVTINIGGSTSTVTCTALAWSQAIDTSALADGTITITADTTDAAGNNATQSTLSVRKYALIPSSIPNISLWLDAGDPTKRFINSNCTTAASTTNDSVGCWQDKSGFSRHATMSTSSQQAKLNLSTNSASIQLDGINDVYDNARSYSAKTVYIVYRMDSTLQESSDLGQLWGEYTAGHVAADGRTVGSWSFDGSTSQKARHSLSGNSLVASSTENTPTQPWSYNSFTLIRVVFDNTIAITRQVIGSLLPNFAVGTHQLGAQISEIVVYSTEPSTVNTQKIEGYLSCKWNLQASLPGGHPYKTNCP